MSSNSSREKCSLTTRGDGKSRVALLEELCEVLERLEWPTADVFGIQMAVEEAVSNAYQHGNLEGKLGDVELQWLIDANTFHFEVRDQGQGFDESIVPDPTDAENLEKLTGRGLLLMRKFMTAVKFEDGGRLVVLQKTRNSA